MTFAPAFRMHLLLSTLAQTHFADAPAALELVLALHALADGGGASSHTWCSPGVSAYYLFIYFFLSRPTFSKLTYLCYRLATPHRC